MFAIIRIEEVYHDFALLESYMQYSRCDVYESGNPDLEETPEVRKL